jgi:hypothetical protein
MNPSGIQKACVVALDVKDAALTHFRTWESPGGNGAACHSVEDRDTRSREYDTERFVNARSDPLR